MSSRASGAAVETPTGGQDSGVDEASTAPHGVNLRLSAPPTGRCLRSGSGEGLDGVDSDAVDLGRRSPRRDRRKASLGGASVNAPLSREPPRSSSRHHHQQQQASFGDTYSSNMPWIPAVIAFAKRFAIYCAHYLPFCCIHAKDSRRR